MAKSSGSERRTSGSWAPRVARVAGIDLRIHATFILLLAWIGLSHLVHGHGAALAFRALLLMLCVFAIIVLHELGHALVARRFGIQTHDITLLPIGGIARLERIPTRPVEELLIAVAGPAVNVVLAGGLLLLLLVTGGDTSFAAPGSTSAPLLQQLLWVNVSLAVFNLLPAFPMDGGRVLRALLATRLPRARATAWAALVGQGFALLLGLLGLFANPMLLLFALFIWIGAQQEAQQTVAESVLARYSAGQAMVTEVEGVSPESTLAAVSERVLAGFQQDFPVMSDGRVVGVLTFRDLLQGLAQSGGEAPVSRYMHARFASAAPEEQLDVVLARVEAGNLKSVIVEQHGKLLGMVNPDNVRELLRIDAARHAVAPTEQPTRGI
jgi:Zn-dependent protease/predicted transcriptional regulator